MTPRVLAEQIARGFDSRAICPVGEAIESTVSRLAPNLSRLEVAEVVERDEAYVIQELVRYIDERRSLNRTVAFELTDSGVILGVDYNPTRSRARRRFRLLDVVALIRSSEPQQFEKLCFGVIRLLTPHDIVRTPQTRDGGVDIFAFLSGPIKGLTAPRIVFCVEAKTERLTMPAYRSFLGAVDITFANRRRGLVSNVPSRFVICDREPLLLAMFTTHEVTRDVRAQAGRDGVLILEADHLAGLTFPHLDHDLSVDVALSIFIERYSSWTIVS